MAASFASRRECRKETLREALALHDPRRMQRGTHRSATLAVVGVVVVVDVEAEEEENQQGPLQCVPGITSTLLLGGRGGEELSYATVYPYSAAQPVACTPLLSQLLLLFLPFVLAVVPHMGSPPRLFLPVKQLSRGLPVSPMHSFRRLELTGRDDTRRESLP